MQSSATDRTTPQTLPAFSRLFRAATAIVSVKGGDNVGVAMVRDLGHVVERERARIGVLVTLAQPTRPMLTEAVKAGIYETEYGKYPRIQIRTVEELLAGNKPQIPLVDTSGFRRARKEDLSHTRQTRLL